MRLGRLGTINKNVLSLFVKLANILQWPIFIENSERLRKDKSFPPMNTHIVGEGQTDYYQLEKSNGQWQIQFVNDDGVEEVTAWQTTVKFEECLSFALEVAVELKKRGQEF